MHTIQHTCVSKSCIGQLDISNDWSDFVDCESLKLLGDWASGLVGSNLISLISSLISSKPWYIYTKSDKNIKYPKEYL